MKALTIKSTTDYSQFKLIKGYQRDIEERAILKLVKKIKKSNLLPINPITVNSNMEVVRGQHRLKAAEQLNIPIYYIVSDLLKNEDIATEHESSKKWQPQDYVKRYATVPNENQNSYRYIYQKHKETGLPLNTLATIYRCGNMRHNGTTPSNLSSGNFKIQSLNEGNKIVDEILDYERLFGDNCKKARFHMALARMIESPNYQHDKFINKIEQQHRDRAMKMPLTTEFDFATALQFFYNKLMTNKINILED